MCGKNEVGSSFIKLFTLFFIKRFNVKTLAILSTAKHLKYSMKYTDFRHEALKKHKINYECSISINFLQDVTEAVFLKIA